MLADTLSATDIEALCIFGGICLVGLIAFLVAVVFMERR